MLSTVITRSCFVCFYYHLCVYSYCTHVVNVFCDVLCGHMVVVFVCVFVNSYSTVVNVCCGRVGCVCTSVVLCVVCVVL